jgi:hypothetical protein
MSRGAAGDSRGTGGPVPRPLPSRTPTKSVIYLSEQVVRDTHRPTPAPAAGDRSPAVPRCVAAPDPTATECGCAETEAWKALARKHENRARAVERRAERAEARVDALELELAGRRRKRTPPPRRRGTR